MSIVQTRPAETLGATGGAAGIIVGIAAGNTLAAALSAIAFLPAVATFVVTHGGIRGVFSLAWRGK